MAADRPQSDRELWAQLYPDEASAETQAEAVRLGLVPQDLNGAPAADAEDSAPLDPAPLAAMLARIRQEDFGEDVPTAVHASIMDAARAHAAARTTGTIPPTEAHAAGALAIDDRTVRASARAPRTSAAPDEQPNAPQPGWARARLSVGGQFALVATVLLSVGAVFWLQSAGTQTSVKYNAAEGAVIQRVTFDSPPSAYPQPRAAAPSAAPGDRAEALPPRPAPAQDTERQDVLAQQLPKTLEGADTRTSRASAAEGAREQEGEMFAMADRATREAPVERGQRPPAEPRREAMARRRASTAARPAPPAKKSAAIDLWGADEAPAPAAARAEPTPAAPTKPSALDAIAESFASAHYREVITRADSFTARSDVPGNQKAQALEYKARAQKSLGQSGAALDTYERLQADHPNYKSREIAAQIEQLRDAQMNMRRPAAGKPAPSMPKNRPASVDSTF